MSEGTSISASSTCTEVGSSSVVGSCHDIVHRSREIVVLSKRRWAILFAMSIFGMTSFLTSELSPILHTMLELLDVSLHEYVYIQQFFNYLPAFMTVPTAWFIDHYGIRIAMYWVTGLMLIRNISKAFLFNPDISHWKSLKMAYYIVTNVTGTQIMISYFCMPLKVSENWFSRSERSLAWTVMMSASSIGISIAAFALPRFIHSVQDVKPLFYLNLGCAAVTAIIVFACITRSKPKHPPSERMVKSRAEPIQYFSSLKKTFQHKSILVHLIHEAIFEGLFLSSMTIVQDILISSGHSPIFVGNLISINAIFSVLMLIALSTFVHRVKNITIACKVASLGRSVFFVIHLLTMLHPLSEWIIIVFALIFNIFRSWASPTFNNMTAHLATGIVSEATIAGISVTIIVLTVSLGQLMFVGLMSTFNGKSDYTYSITCASLIALIDSILYLIFFRAKETNQAQRANQETVNQSHSPIN